MILDRVEAEALLSELRQEENENKTEGQWADEKSPVSFKYPALYKSVAFILQQMIYTDDKQREDSAPVLDNPNFLSTGQ